MKGGPLAEHELVHSILVRASIDEVWSEITQVRGRQRAMMDAEFSASTTQVRGACGGAVAADDDGPPAGM